MLGDYIAHIHIKNGMLKPEGTDENGVRQWKRSWTPLKEGSADLKKLFRVMKEMNYQGNISVEDFSNEESTYEKIDVKQTYDKLESIRFNNIKFNYGRETVIEHGDAMLNKGDLLP